METQQFPSANDYIDLITYLDVKFRAAEYISTNDKQLFSEEFPVFLRGVKLDFFFRDSQSRFYRDRFVYFLFPPTAPRAKRAAVGVEPAHMWPGKQPAGTEIGFN